MNKKHDPLFRWHFANPRHTRDLLKLAAKKNDELQGFLETVDMNSLERIPDSFSEVDETGEADVAFRAKVSTGAPVLVGILLEHKSGQDGEVLNQISRYVHSVMKRVDEKGPFDGLPTMAVIFYNGRDNWNPLKNIEEGYPEYWHGFVLPFKCVFVNFADVDDEDCLAFDDVSTAMVVLSMKYAYNGAKILEILPKFRTRLNTLGYNEATCLLSKLMLYLREYLNDGFLKELDMAFVSVGQKYGFVSAGDLARKREAEALEKGEAIGEQNKAREIAKNMKSIGIPIEQIVAVSGLTAADVEAL